MKINRILSAVAVGAVGLGLVPVLTATAAQAAPAALAGFDGTHTGVDGNRSVYYRWDASQALSRADLGPTGSATVTTVVRADAAAASWTTDGELESFGFARVIPGESFTSGGNTFNGGNPLGSPAHDGDPVVFGQYNAGGAGNPFCANNKFFSNGNFVFGPGEECALVNDSADQSTPVDGGAQRFTVTINGDGTYSASVVPLDADGDVVTSFIGTHADQEFTGTLPGDLTTQFAPVLRLRAGAATGGDWHYTVSGSSLDVSAHPLGSCAATADESTTTMSLTANCTTSSTLTVPNGWTLDGAGHTITAVDPSSSNTFSGPVVTNEAVANAEMFIRNLTVHGDLGQPTSCSYTLSGIEFNAASGSLSHTTVSDIRNGAGSGCQPGNAVNITKDPASSGRTTVTVDDVHVTGFQKTGIRINGKVSVNLTDSSIADAQLDDVLASNSVQISRGARANVSDNTIGGNDWDGTATDSATGVLLYGAGDVTFTRNVISGTDTDFGLYAYEDATYSAGHLSLTCNLLERSAAVDTTGGARDVWNTGVYVDGTLAGTVNAAGNTVRGFATPYQGVTSTVGGACASDAVTDLHAQGTTTTLKATWTAPAAQPFAPVTSYDVTLNPGGAHTTVTGTSATFSGLTAGRTYTVTVVPVNAAGNGASASASAYGTAVSAVPSVTTILSGKTLTITGKVTDAQTGKAVAGQSITLLSRVQGTTTYVSNGVRATSAANGTFSISVKQGLTKRYYVATGGQDRMGATSTGFTVKARGTATIALNHASVIHGHKVTFSGKVAPKAATVELQRKVGSTWVTVKTVVTTNGAYSFGWTPLSTTDFSWRVRVSGPTFSAGTSTTKVLKVS